jgi:hypothetical protein
MNVSSGWVEDNNINPYLENRDKLLKLGKPKTSFNKAIAEIDEFIKNPAVSYLLTYPELA